MALCGYCKAIPYRDLPFEEDDGISHQPSLRALLASAETCGLCAMLSQAAFRNRAYMRQRKCGGSRMPIGHRMYTKFDPSNPKRLLICELGMYSPGTYEFCKPQGEENPNIEPPVFCNDESMKCWLFGNWYRKPTSFAKKLGASDDPPQFQLIGLGIRLGPGPGIEHGEGNTWDQAYSIGTVIRLRTMDEYPTSEYIPGRPCAAWSGSSTALKRIRTWLAKCEGQHTLCGNTSTAMPTRVLYVFAGQDRRRIRLLNTNGLRGKYTALSHCWGKNLKAKTTRDIMRTLQSDIPFCDLPRTFRDAVSLTRKLNIAFLWIDSLCIIQDDKADLARELPRMADVYGNAWVTLSAAHSHNSESGLYAPSLFKRPPNDQTLENRSVALHYAEYAGAAVFERDRSVSFYSGLETAGALTRDITGRQSIITHTVEWMPPSRKDKPTINRLGEFGRPVDPLANQHLQTRAWTLQERLLSRRTIHFTTEQMLWECCEEFVAEDGIHGDMHFRDLTTLLGRENLLRNAAPRYLSGSDARILEDKSSRWQSDWREHIEGYSAREMTHENDKLTALSGLAALIQKTSGDEYCAGLWRSILIEELAWKAYPIEEQHEIGGSFSVRYGDRGCRMSRPSTYRAPSWSWACLNGHIRFKALTYSRITARILECRVEPTNVENPFGSLKSGWLKINGPFYPLKKSYVQPNANSGARFRLGISYEVTASSNTWDGDIHFDLEGEEDPGIGLLGNTSPGAADPEEPRAQHKRNSLSLSRIFSSKRNSKPDTNPITTEKPKSTPVASRMKQLYGLFLNRNICLVVRPRGEASKFDHQSFERVGLGDFSSTVGENPHNQGEVIDDSAPRATIVIY